MPRDHSVDPMGATADAVRHTERTLKSPRAWAVLLSVLVASLGVDLWSKYAAFEHVGDTPVHFTREEVLAAKERGVPLGVVITQNHGGTFPQPHVVVPSVLNFELVLNPGAIFGLGAGKRWYFIGFTLLALVLGLWMFAQWTRPREHIAHASIALILSGGLGNLYDRWVYACVRDFLHPLPGVQLPWGLEWPWGGRDVWPYVSNIADLWLLIGVAVLIVRTLRVKGPAAP